MVAELQVDKGSEGARLFCFHAGGDRWIQKDLIYPLPLTEEDREWVPAGVVAQEQGFKSPAIATAIAHYSCLRKIKLFVSMYNLAVIIRYIHI
jgi:hypothetical protein